MHTLDFINKDFVQFDFRVNSDCSYSRNSVQIESRGRVNSIPTKIEMSGKCFFLCDIPVHMGNPAIYGSFESVHRTADIGSSIDTFLCG